MCMHVYMHVYMHAVDRKYSTCSSQAVYIPRYNGA